MSRALPLLIGLVASMSVLAQADDPLAETDTEAGIQRGALNFVPTLGVSVGFDDNVALLPDGSEAVDSAFWMLSPALRALLTRRSSRWMLELEADRYAYFEDGVESYTDWAVQGVAELLPTARDRVLGQISWQRQHNRRGEGVREFFPDALITDVDEYTTKNLELSWRRGRQDRRHILLGARWHDLAYQDSPELAALANYSSFGLNGRFQTLLGKRTRGFVALELERVDFDAAMRDHDDRLLGAGVQWSATARTLLEGEIGRQTQRYDDFSDFSGVYWSLGGRWEPRTYSEFLAKVSRRASFALGESIFVERNELEMHWNHEWPREISTSVDVSFADESLEPAQRSDELFLLGISARYPFRRWIMLGAGLQHYQRESSDARFSYERTELLLTAEFGL